MAFSAKSMIEQMQARYKELAVKLEGYQAIQEEMATLAKAIKVMRGEKLTPGRVTGEHKPKKEWASKIIANSEDNGSYSPHPNGAKNAAHAVLLAHPKGLTIRQIGEALTKQGITVTDHTVHNAMRPFKNEIRVVGTDTGSRGQTAKIYALKETK